MSKKQNPNDLLPLTPAVFHILLVLTDGEKHGYAIMQTIKDITGGSFTMGPGTLYGSIKRMIHGGLIIETEQRPSSEEDDERRRYYKLTDFGQQVVTAEVRRLQMLVNSQQSLRLLGEI